jgi:hypothetical protein
MELPMDDAKKQFHAKVQKKFDNDEFIIQREQNDSFIMKN